MTDWQQSPATGLEQAIAAGLLVRIVQQDGSVETLHYADTVHNRQLVNYIERHESFALQSRNHRKEQDNASI